MRAAWLIVLAALPSIACAAQAQGPLAGASDAWASAAEPAPTASVRTPRPVWEAYAEAQRWPLANAAPFTSHGHPPEQQVDVRVNEPARAIYAALVADSVFPEGSTLAELSHGGTGSNYVMRKDANGWSYLQLDAQGALLQSGALGGCAGCHAQAPADHVFGPPRDP